MATTTTTKKKAMTKTALVNLLAEEVGIPKKQAGQALEKLVDTAYDEVKRAGSFTLPGLGKLVLSNRKARTGVHPKTGEPIQIPAKTSVKFRVSKACKDSVIPPKK